ncbi:hypothetical protein [Natronorubrum texcoconense]|uniref:DUF456 domain-containing protein n=1 Tax=Natronorubrum texcoconense TaxID=1095776 RepID=A0A1G8YLX7_9EURY|nr:hypothetical protein [Natronorubrum texcoconense]SDK03872.1 hypothetical protein SAMN04515672_2221 [Natronorubrum texcoconense]
MSDRSEEVTESRDTEDLLAETEELLSGTGGGVDTDEPRAPAESEPRRSVETDSRPSSTPLDTPAESDTKSGSSRLSRLRSKLSIPTSGPSLEQYFSPRAFFAFVLLVGTGLVAGGMTIPFAGRVLGMFGVAFAIGLLTSKRRYLEMAAAGTTVGGLSALASYTVLAVAGSYQAVVAVGVAAGLVGCLIGYYFGRDLRNGLVRDID